MLKVITEQAAIKKHAGQFNKKFKPFIDEEIKVKLGHQGASFPAKVLWSSSLDIWKFSRAVKDVRYWNAFGVEKPGTSGVLSIASEINFPWAQIDRKTGGAFAQDSWGNVFVVHRGKIGGGRKGVGKSLFEQSYRGVWSFMEDGASISQVAVIGHLASSRFALQVAQFVKKIEIMKLSAAESTQTEMDFSEITFREDLIGSETSLSEDEIISACDHDLVVSELAVLLQRQKIKIGNDMENELFTVDSSENRISHIFEIVTDAKEKNILAAAGKLLLQTSAAAVNPLPVLVLPEEKINQYETELRRINISVIGFYWREENAVFSGLEKIRFE
ncbi:5-methylcytosine-specific restriction enzyme mcrb related [hydrocarbon metagenome]|uniref:5-methylcytosine-specific restriction enzyme mcrb related n=1 Tax=hydrocarbon metagenome TaxID=938273 RepID=A0A0W8FSI7_9ZZZZ